MAYSRQSSSSQGSHICFLVGVLLVFCLLVQNIFVAKTFLIVAFIAGVWMTYINVRDWCRSVTNG